MPRAPDHALDWYFEYLDRLATQELKNRPTQQGGTDLRYRAARDFHAGRAICGQIAGALVALRRGSTVVLVTGTGNPEWLPQGETDGPSGVAVLSRVLSGLGVRSCILSEARFLPGVIASVRAAGVPVLEEGSWRQRENAAWALEFPTGAAAAPAFIGDLLERLGPVGAGVFIEKPGPNALGVFHNSSGKPKDPDWVAHAHRLCEALAAQGIVTVGIGDGGNEIGFGPIRERLLDALPLGRVCGCPCQGGLLDATEVDWTFPVAVSNWGAYAIAVALALLVDRPQLLPSWAEVAASIAAPIAHGAFDGFTGMALPSTDAVSLEANQGLWQLMLEVLRLARAPAH